jgi:ComF family protein
MKDTNIFRKGGKKKILVLNLIYPPTCGICGKLNSNFLCKKCEKQLELQSKFEIEENQNINYYFEEHLYIFEYQGIIRKIILDYKFNDKSYLYKTIVNFLLKNEKFFKIVESYDTIIPVPISKKRKKERGYNQSELIAREIARNLPIEYNNRCIFKIKNIVEQSKLNKEERQKNIQGVYELRNQKLIQNKKILLIDDIYTTGSTVNECSKILGQAQPKKIGILTVAKD